MNQSLSTTALNVVKKVIWLIDERKSNELMIVIFR